MSTVCCSSTNNSLDAQSGIFILRDNKGLVLTLGTFNNEKKDGIWTFYKNDTIESQVYYENDSARYRLNPAINFKLLIDSINNFRIIVPQNWETQKSSEKYKELLISGVSALVPSKIKPTYNIALLPLEKETSLEKIIARNIQELQSDVNIKISEKSLNQFTYKTNIEDLELYVTSKILLFENYYIIVTCASDSNFFLDYQPIFKTILNSIEKNH